MLDSAKPYKVDLANGFDANLFLPHEVLFYMLRATDLHQWCLPEDRLQDDRGLGLLLRQWSEHDDVNYAGSLADVPMIGIHADGVAYTTTMRAGGSKGVLVASMNVISARTDRQRSMRMPLFVVSKAKLCRCGCSGFHSLQYLYEVTRSLLGASE
jgi:hypothetical protein